MMNKKESLKVIESTRLDISLFHSIVVEELDKHSFNSPIMMSWNDCIDCVNSVMSLLFKHHPRCLMLNNDSTRAILHFFDEQEFIDIFDDLQMKFNDFLEDMGIYSKEKYLVKRIDTFNTIFMRLDDESFQEATDQLYKAQYGCTPLFTRFKLPCGDC